MESLQAALSCVSFASRWRWRYCVIIYHRSRWDVRRANDMTCKWFPSSKFRSLICFAPENCVTRLLRRVLYRFVYIDWCGSPMWQLELAPKVVTCRVVRAVHKSWNANAQTCICTSQFCECTFVTHYPERKCKIDLPLPLKHPGTGTQIA